MAEQEKRAPTREECLDEFSSWLAGVLVAREADEAAARNRASVNALADVNVLGSVNLNDKQGA